MSEPIVENEEKIKDVHLAEELSSRYLSYAMSTIVSRSLPDVRDGLKPVHRRLLFAMRQLHLDIRWLTGKATLATLMATAPLPCVILRPD